MGQQPEERAYEITAGGVLALLLLSACTTTTPRIAYIDSNTEPSKIELPSPFNEAPRGGEGYLILLFSNGGGNQACTFSVAVDGMHVGVEAWKDRTVEQGFDALATPSKTQVLEATRTCIMRLPAGKYQVIASANDESYKRTVEITAGAIQDQVVLYTGDALAIGELKEYSKIFGE